MTDFETVKALREKGVQWKVIQRDLGLSFYKVKKYREILSESRSRKPSRTFCVHLPKNLTEALDKEALAEGVSRSEIVRRACTTYLGEDPCNSLPTPSQSGPTMTTSTFRYLRTKGL